MGSTDHKRRTKDRKIQLPGVKHLLNFAESFKEDFDSLQSPRSRKEININFGPLSQGGSRIYELTELTESINVESSLTTIKDINNPVAVDNSQPNIVHTQESSTAVTSASSSSSTSHVIFVSSGDAMNSCKAAALEGVTLAVPYPSPPVTEDGRQEASKTEEDSRNEESNHLEDIVGDDDISATEEDSRSEETDDAKDLASNDEVSETEEDNKSEEIHDAEDVGSDDDVSETEEDSESEEIDDANGIVSHRPRPNRTYEIHHCHTVIMNDFNARGIKIKGSGNNAPQITYNDAPPSSRSSESSSHADLDLSQSSRYQVIPPDFSQRNLPPTIPPLPFEASGDSSLYEEEQAPMSPRVTIGTNLLTQVSDDAISGQPSPKMPGSKTLPCPEESELPQLSAHPILIDLHSSLFSPFPGAIQNALPNNTTAAIASSQLNPHSRRYPVDSPLAINSSAQELSPDSDLIRLEHQLKSVLETVLTIQKKLPTSGISSSAEILTPRAQRILGAVNALVSTESFQSEGHIYMGCRHCPSCESLYSHP